jgi:hypothetical protein
MELVYKNEHQRFYKVDFDINYGLSFGKVKKVSDMVHETYEGKYAFTLPKNLTVEDMIEKSKRLVCISDAHTHTERLAFGAMYFEDTKQYGRLLHCLDGKNTFMIHGGDDDAVYPDKVYIKHLRMINKTNKQNKGVI